MNFLKHPFRMALTGACLVLISCSGPSISILDQSVSGGKSVRKLLSAETLDPASKLTLKKNQLQKLYRSDPDQAIQKMWALYKKQPTDDRKIAIAEMCFDQGLGLSETQPKKALGYYLDSAKLCKVTPTQKTDLTYSTKPSVLYKHAVANVVQILQNKQFHAVKQIKVHGSLYEFSFDVAKGKKYLHPRDFDLLVSADQLKIKGIKLRSVTQEGIGTAMVGRFNATPHRLAADPFMPPGGHHYSLNARLEFSGSSATLLLQDVLIDSNTMKDGKKVPLASDFTASLASYVENTDKTYSGLKAMLKPEGFSSRVGMYSIEPFRENKIPLILVHGLKSRAQAWVYFINRLRVDPVIRERYQIILFNYPTGHPVAKNAADLRDSLADFRSVYDPQGRNPYLENSVIVGHSMGGVISSMQIRNSGNKLYKAIFTTDINKLPFTSEERELSRKRLFYKANTDLDRVIFIAAPHRGSSFTLNFIGRLGSRLIKLPLAIADGLLDRPGVISFLTKEAQLVSLHSRNSITSLKPDDPILSAVLKTPVRQGVKIHSIIAQANQKSPMAGGTDRVVHYPSAHLKYAVSEKIVINANHCSVLQKEETITEVWRILHQHLRAHKN